uniref:Uncharacterized protein n=1 Tax=Peronospora matthiolae TaxID=2874970 RepID=A0AAV1V9L2_9STRA
MASSSPALQRPRVRLPLLPRAFWLRQCPRVSALPPQPLKTPERLLAYPAGLALRCPTGYRFKTCKIYRATAPRVLAGSSRVRKHVLRPLSLMRAPSQTWDGHETMQTLMLGPAGRQACCPTESSPDYFRASAPRVPTGCTRVLRRVRRLPPALPPAPTAPSPPRAPRMLLLDPAGRQKCCPTGFIMGQRFQPQRPAPWGASHGPSDPEDSDSNDGMASDDTDASSLDNDAATAHPSDDDRIGQVATELPARAGYTAVATAAPVCNGAP